jgi:hypothetical protein
MLTISDFVFSFLIIISLAFIVIFLTHHAFQKKISYIPYSFWNHTNVVGFAGSNIAKSSRRAACEKKFRIFDKLFFFFWATNQTLFC